MAFFFIIWKVIKAKSGRFYSGHYFVEDLMTPRSTKRGVLFNITILLFCPGTQFQFWNCYSNSFCFLFSKKKCWNFFSDKVWKSRVVSTRINISLGIKLKQLIAYLKGIIVLRGNNMHNFKIQTPKIVKEISQCLNNLQYCLRSLFNFIKCFVSK